MLLVNLSVGRIQSTLTTGAEKGTVFVKKHAPSGTPGEVKGYWCREGTAIVQGRSAWLDSHFHV